jgi:uncharacterized membrane protein
MNECADGQKRAERNQLLMLLAIFLGMAALQVSLARRPSLWTDEIFSLALATGHSLEHPAAAADPKLGDFVEPDHPVETEYFRRYLKHDDPPAGPARVIRAVLLSDTSPPLYYLLLYGWTLICGTSDFVLRLFSVAWLLASFPFLASVARRTAGNVAVIPACLLFALSPLGFYFAVEARMYSLMLFCVLVTAWVSLVLHEKGGSIALYVTWIIASAAGFLTHYFFLFPWLAIVAFLVVRPGAFKRQHLAVCILLTALAILPWYSLVVGSMNRWRVTQGWLKLRPEGFRRFHATSTQFVQFFSGSGSGLWNDARWSSWAAIALFALVTAAVALRLRFQMFNDRRLFLWFWFVAACSAPSVIDVLQGTFVANHARYVFAGMAAAYLLVAVMLAHLGFQARVFVLFLVALLWASPLVNIYRKQWRGRQPFRQVARAVIKTGNTSDLILIHSIPAGVLGLARYLDGPVQLASWIQQLGTRRVPESLHSLVTGRQRILFVRVEHALRESKPEEDWLRANARMVEEKHFESVTVMEFRPKSAETF